MSSPAVDLASAASARGAGPGAIAALLAGVALLVFGTNLQGVLLPILGHERGSSMIAIGLFSAGWSAGFVVACLSIGWMLHAFGHVRAFALLASLSAVCGLMLVRWPMDSAWIALRLIIGFCYGGLSAIIEGWLIERAGSGTAFASYMVANLLASLCGTLSLNVVNPKSWTTLALGAATIAASTMPIVLGRMKRPAPVPTFRPLLAVSIRQSPVGATGCVMVGLITGAIGGLGPIYGMMSGLDMRGDTLMLAANSVGGALAYAPVSLLASRLDRRTVLGLIATFGIAICAFLVSWGAHLTSIELVLIVGAFGFVQYPIYGLCVGIANEEQKDRPTAQIATELLLLFGLGTIAGPMIAGQVMREGPEQLFSFIAALLFVVLCSVTFGRSPSLGRTA